MWPICSPCSCSTAPCAMAMVLKCGLSSAPSPDGSESSNRLDAPKVGFSIMTFPLDRSSGRRRKKTRAPRGRAAKLDETLKPRRPCRLSGIRQTVDTVSYTHLRAHETDSYLVCRLLLEKKKKK